MYVILLRAATERFGREIGAAGLCLCYGVRGGPVTVSSPMAGPPGATEASTRARAVLDRLSQRRLVVVSGKGGVGRTTVAAMLGMAFAQRGRRVLIATTGHDDRLAWMFGAERLTQDAQAISPGLSIVRLVPQRCISEYGGMVMHSQRLSSTVFDNRVVRRLLRAIPGLDDFAVLGKAWHEGIRGGTYDTVVFDGPATGHLLYTLGVPQAILQTVPHGPLTKEAQLMQDSLEDASRVEAVLVGLPELWPLTELGELGANLRQQLGMHLGAIVVNGAWPSAVPVLPPLPPEQDPEGVVAPALELTSRIGRIGQAQRAEVQRWKGTQAAARCQARALLTVPWRWEGVLDQDSITALIDGVMAEADGSSADASLAGQGQGSSA